MKQQALCLLGVAAMILAAGCSSGYRAVYDIGLIDAERPAEAQQEYGTQVVKVIGEVGKELSHFEDNMVAIGWTPTPDEFQMEVSNKTNEPIEINWNDGAYIDEDGNRHRIVHSKVIYEDREKHQKPSVVEPGGTLSETIRSADNIYYEGGINARFREKPFFPTYAKSQDELDRETSALANKTVKIALPLEANGKEQLYVFVFKVKHIKVEKARGKDKDKGSTWTEEDQYAPIQY